MDEQEQLVPCDLCNGSGYLYMCVSDGELKVKLDPTIGLKVYCHKCFGHGVLNWIEYIFGKQQSFEIDEDETFYNGNSYG